MASYREAGARSRGCGVHGCLRLPHAAAAASGSSSNTASPRQGRDALLLRLHALRALSTRSAPTSASRCPTSTGWSTAAWCRSRSRPTPRRPPPRSADLATDTGTASNGAKTWKFTLKDGVKWQDGKAITCEDFKYGASRVFATDVITGGPNYILSYLDVPDGQGRSPGLQGSRTRRPARPTSTRRSPATARPSPTTSRSRGRTSPSPSRRCT